MKKVKDEIDYMDLDVGVRSIVRYFNDHGLPTLMSCEGHNTTNMSMFWVRFDPSVSEDDILRFQQMHVSQQMYANQLGVFCSCGRFAMRTVYGMYGVNRSWEYFAATKEAAFEDLRRWERCSLWKNKDE